MKPIFINRKSRIFAGTTLIVIGVAVIMRLVLLFPALRIEEKQVLFEFGAANSWTITTKGFFIDSEGNIYTYKNGTQGTQAFFRFFSNTEEEISYKPSDLVKYYGEFNQLVDKIDPNTLKEMVSLIVPASKGKLSNDDPLTPPSCRSKDAGFYIYRAYLYDRKQRMYKPVYLYSMGDIKEVNLSPEARKLHEWLETLCIENEYYSSCKPNENICRP